MMQKIGTTERLPTSQLIIYALGQMGWALASYGVFNLLIYFYLPPNDGTEAIFPPFIYTGAVLGVMTVIGLVAAGGRLFDAFTDPLIARWSDRMDASWGRRRKMMAIGVLPFALLSFFCFYPPSLDTSTNTIYLVGCLLLFYIFFTTYFVPYTALIGELGKTPAERLRISTAVSVSWALGFILGAQVFLFKSMLDEQMGDTAAFQTVMAAFAILAFVLMLMPIIFLKEKQYVNEELQEQKSEARLADLWKIKDFRAFLLSDACYWIGITFVQIGMVYYTVELFKREESDVSFFQQLMFLASFVCYPLVFWWSKRSGKRQLILIAFLLLAGIFGLIALPGLGQSTSVYYGLAIMGALPMAIFSILPNVVVADLANDYSNEHGKSAAGLFYAARSLMMKIGISLGNLLFPSLLLLNSYGENFGSRVTAIVAIGTCLLGYLFMRGYNRGEG